MHNRKAADMQSRKYGPHPKLTKKSTLQFIVSECYVIIIVKILEYLWFWG